MFGLAQPQKMEGKGFCINLLDLVWFLVNGLWREVGGFLQKKSLNLLSVGR